MASLVQAVKNTASVAMSVALLAGCAIGMKVPVKEPAPSGVAFEKRGSASPLVLAFRDEQSQADKATPVSGTIPMSLTSLDKPFDAAPWIADHTAKEMVSRGLPVTLAGPGASGTSVVIRRMHIENHRASGFSPFVTFTSLRADVDTPQGPKRVTAYVKRGKVPVWSFDEVIEPTFNEPLHILTKELAAKLNQQFFKQMASDSQVNALIAKINKDAATRADAYLDVYQLGFSNNPLAIPALVTLADSPSEYVRLAAVSSLGVLKANAQLQFLIARHESPTLIWQDRGMALKAIGDLDTAESRAYLQKRQDVFKAGMDKESIWTREIISLYLL
jgi:hypothetical protein